MEITRILQAVQRSEPGARDRLLGEVYQELRRLAACKMAGEASPQTLQPTALVHEAWLRLAQGDQPFENRRHFFAAAGEAMRRLLIENARRKARLKRGGDQQKVNLEDVEIPSPMPDDELLALDEALTRLRQAEPRAAEIVDLCFFAGLTQEQAARELGISVTTVERSWAYARAWLFKELHKE